MRAAGAAFDTFFITGLAADELVARTTLDEADQTWVSQVQIPLGYFNVDAGEAAGTDWRMNFFRTTTSAETTPAQGFGAWNPPDELNFHMSPYFGRVHFV